MKTAVKVIVLAAAAGLFVLAAKAYLGYHFFYRYAAAREVATNLQGSFSLLEPKLERAVSFTGNPLFYQELGRLYLEMALAENKFGTPEKRDAYLDRARESLEGLIRRNPLDAFGYYEMGKVYMLYNYPLLTYAAKGRAYFRRALEMRPVHEDLNVDVLYACLAQWARLSEPERDFVTERVARNVAASESFFPWIISRWLNEYKSVEKLQKIFAEYKDLWPQVSRYFPIT